MIYQINLIYKIFDKNFDAQELLNLSRLYKDDFSQEDIFMLKSELSTFKWYWKSHKGYKNLGSLEDLSIAMVDSEGNKCYPITYKLLILILTLPVATASSESSFSALKIIKNRLRSSISDRCFRDLMVIYIEKEIGRNIDKDSVINYFNKMKPRRPTNKFNYFK